MCDAIRLGKGGCHQLLETSPTQLPRCNCADPHCLRIELRGCFRNTPLAHRKQNPLDARALHSNLIGHIVHGHTFTHHSHPDPRGRRSIPFRCTHCCPPAQTIVPGEIRFEWGMAHEFDWIECDRGRTASAGRCRSNKRSASTSLSGSSASSTNVSPQFPRVMARSPTRSDSRLVRSWSCGIDELVDSSAPTEGHS